MQLLNITKTYLGAQQQLRRSVPQCHNNRSVVLKWRTVLPSKSKVSNLQNDQVDQNTLDEN